MAKITSLDHAEHNEKACKYLNRKPDFLDWVITTAFYSALHFINHKIFPYKVKVNGKMIIIKDFATYCNNYKKDTTRKHHQLSALVEEKCPEIADDYNQLKDISWTARYSRYQYDRDISDLAVKRLGAVKKYCVG
ncbi:hypothetical protein GF354_01950 [Candidatus Peregrinibacteria bacterium]|nr:hypothetical protein [Candidatus Peregrinibacteria bacterium]